MSITEELDRALGTHFLLAIAVGAAIFLLAYQGSSRLRRRFPFDRARWIAITAFLFLQASIFFFHPHHVWVYLGQSLLLGILWGVWSPLRN